MLTPDASIYLVSACTTPQEFVAAFRRYADRSGVFVPIAAPLPAAKRGRFALTLRDGGVMIEGEAEVIASSPTPSALHGRVGMTLRFVQLEGPSAIVAAELEKARLAVTPAPPSVGPRPATIPDAPRPIAPPVGGRIDAATALAQCVAIGDVAALVDVARSAKGGAAFVVPTIPVVPGRSRTPSSSPLAQRPKPARPGELSETIPVVAPDPALLAPEDDPDADAGSLSDTIPAQPGSPAPGDASDEVRPTQRRPAAAQILAAMRPSGPLLDDSDVSELEDDPVAEPPPPAPPPAPPPPIPREARRTSLGVGVPQTATVGERDSDGYPVGPTTEHDVVPPLVEPKVQIDPSLLADLPPLRAAASSRLPTPATGIASDVLGPTAEYDAAHLEALGIAPGVVAPAQLVTLPPAPASRGGTLVIAISAMLAAVLGIVAFVAVGRCTGSSAPGTPPPPAPVLAVPGVDAHVVPVVVPPAPSVDAAATIDAGDGACRVALASKPDGAEVLRDGVVIATTPLELPLPCGETISVTLRKPRYGSASRTVTATSDGPPVQVSLPRPLIAVRVLTRPAGATVVVGGKTLGVTPTVVQLPAHATSAMTVRKAGYVTQTVQVTPDAARPTVDLKLLLE